MHLRRAGATNHSGSSRNMQVLQFGSKCPLLANKLSQTCQTTQSAGEQHSNPCCPLKDGQICCQNGTAEGVSQPFLHSHRRTALVLQRHLVLSSLQTSSCSRNNIRNKPGSYVAFLSSTVQRNFPA